MAMPQYKMIEDKLEGWEKLTFRMIVLVASETRSNRRRLITLEKVILAMHDFIRSNPDNFPPELIAELDSLEKTHEEDLERAKEGFDDFEKVLASVMAHLSERAGGQDG